MADWTHKPAHVYDVERIGPHSLETTFSDGTTDVRETSAAVRRIFRERHRDTLANMKTRLDFWDTKTTVTSFTKIAYDSQDASPGVTEVTVRFIGNKPRTSEVANGLVDAVFLFGEVL